MRSLLLACIAFTSCTLFQPETPPEPDGGGSVDYLNLAGIHRDFEVTTYESLFPARADLFLGMNSSYRSTRDFLLRLEMIKTTYDSLVVNWSYNTPGELNHIAGSEFLLPLRRCEIIRVAGTLIDTLIEEHELVVVYDETQTAFQITRWKVMSSEGDRSFFHPDFTE